MPRTRQMVAAADDRRVDRGPQRGRGALPRVQPHQAAPAPLQHPLQGRQVATRTSRSPSTRSGRGRWCCGAPSARASATSARTRTPTRSARPSTCCCARSRSARARKNKFDRHHRLGRPCLYAHIEKCAAPCVGDDRPARSTTSSSTSCSRSSTASTDAILERLDKPDARGRPTRSSSSGRRGCATSSSRSARRSSASRWWRPRKRTSTSSASPRTRSKRRCRSSSCAGAVSSGARGFVVDKVEDVDGPGLVGRAASSSSTATRAPDDVPREVLVPCEPDDARALRGVPHRGASRGRGERRCGASACRSAARSASCSRPSPATRTRRSRSTSCAARPTTTRGPARSRRCRRRSTCPRRRCASSASTSPTCRAPRSWRRWW